jgi:hypothetical protein
MVGIGDECLEIRLFFLQTIADNVGAVISHRATSITVSTNVHGRFQR